MRFMAHMQDVAGGHLMDAGRSYHLCVCSYAMHLLEPSWLFPTLQQLALACSALLLLSPHKLPHVEPRTGWRLAHASVGHGRVHARLFVSTTLLVSHDLRLVV